MEVDLGRCGEIIDSLPLFRSYGLGGDRLVTLIEQERRRADQRHQFLVARRDQRCLGLAWFVLRGAFDRSGYLRLIAVDPDALGVGIGRALMDELERRYLLPGGIVLLANADNLAAHQFYRKLGYYHVGVLPAYVGQGLDEWIFFKGPPAVSA
jgi:ribosomal protein S18 acetylase RimI-like enzyme